MAPSASFEPLPEQGVPQRRPEHGPSGPAAEREGRGPSPSAASSPGRILSLQAQAGNRAVSAMLGRQPQANGPTVQRVLKFGGKQFRSMGDLAGTKPAFDAYFASKAPDKKAKLDATDAVYDLASADLAAVDEAVTPLAPPTSTGLAPVRMSSLTGPSSQELAQAALSVEMARLQPMVRAANVTFVGNRYWVHLKPPAGRDGQANLASTQEVKAIIANATTANMGDGSPGKNGGKNIKVTYGPGLSVVFEFFEGPKKASVFHVGPGG